MGIAVGSVCGRFSAEWGSYGTYQTIAAGLVQGGLQYLDATPHGVPGMLEAFGEGMDERDMADRAPERDEERAQAREVLRSLSLRLPGASKLPSCLRYFPPLPGIVHFVTAGDNNGFMSPGQTADIAVTLRDARVKAACIECMARKWYRFGAPTEAELPGVRVEVTEFYDTELLGFFRQCAEAKTGVNWC